MKSFINKEPIQEIINILEKIPQNIEQSKQEIINYLKYINIKNFEENENKSFKEQIIEAENILDNFLELKQRRTLIQEKNNFLTQFFNQIIEKLNSFLKIMNTDESTWNIKQNELIDKIIELKTKEKDEKIKEINEKYKKDIEILENDRINGKEYNYEKHLNNQMKIYQNYLNKNEIKQIEEWTKLKCGEIVFDSNRDDWSRLGTTFDRKVMGRKQIIILIEDTNHNLFGGFVNVKIEKYSYWNINGNGNHHFNMYNDPNSFLFSLRSNGRIKEGMKKFEIIKPEDAFRIYPPGDSEQDLFELGWGDFRVFTKEKASQSYTANGRSYNYHGIGYALSGGFNFTPQRIFVIQMN